MNHEVDLLGLDDGFNVVRLSGASALQDLEAAAESCRLVMKQSQEEYDELLAKYDALRSRRDGGEVSQGAATDDAAADAYVVLLIDAHSHKFKTNLMQGADSSGSRTAKLLKEAAAELFANLYPGENSYRIVARVYTNLKGLSDEVFDDFDRQNPKLCRPNYPHALGAFAAGFSREEVFFDFVDVVDEETVERKITGLFQLYVKDPQCKQVLLGASGSMSYLRVLEAHQVFSRKVTLIQRGVDDTSLMRLGLNSVTFPHIFDSLSDGNSTKRTSSGNRSLDSNKMLQAVDIKGKHTHAHAMKRTSSALASQLPTRAIPGRIPVNAVGHRLDIYIPPPTQAQWDLYSARKNKKKLCSAFHLGHGCDMPSTCHYDHTPISYDVYYCLKYILKGYTCNYKGECYREDCSYGHVCQKEKCVRGGPRGCRFGRAVHDMDMQVSHWVEEPKLMTREETTGSESLASEGQSSKESVVEWTTPTGLLIDI